MKVSMSGTIRQYILITVAAFHDKTNINLLTVSVCPLFYYSPISDVLQGPS